MGWSGVGTALVGEEAYPSLLGGDSMLGGLFQDMTGQTDFSNTYNRSQDARSRRQDEALGLIGGWGMTGQGPSAAQRLVEMNRSQNAANMISSAKSMPGGNPALANQLASEGIARGNAAATLQGAQLRSAEQQAMIGNYMTGLDQARQQDIMMHQSRLAADQANTAGRQGFIGGVANPIGGMLGGILG